MATNLNDTISYLLKKSLHYVENNEYSFAKCYLLTANTLAADNIMIKFETFSMCKMENNVQDAVKVFTDLFCSAKFDQPTKKDKKDYDELKKMFTVEMKNILHAIKHEWRQCVSPQETEQFFTNQDLPLTTINFYRNVFHALKSENQIKCVRKFCSFFPNQTSLIVDLHLFLIIQHPKSNHSESLTQLIKIKEDLETSTRDDGKLLQYLRVQYVFHILPSLVSEYSDLELADQVMEVYFFNALKDFITAFILNHSGASYLNIDDHELIEHKLVEILTKIGKKKNWEIFKSFDFSLKDMQNNLSFLATFLDSAIAKNESEPMDLSAKSKLDPKILKQMLFFSLILFIICFSRYASFVDRYVLYEKIVAFDISYLPSKKRKLIRNEPKFMPTNKDLLHNFRILTQLNKIIIDVIYKDFESFINYVKLNENHKYLRFQIDLSIYNGQYTQALLKAQLFGSTIEPKQFSDHLMVVQNYIQLANIYIKLSDHKSASAVLISLIELINSEPKGSTSHLTFGKQLESLCTENFHNSEDEDGLLLNENFEKSSELINSNRLIFKNVSLKNVVNFIVKMCIFLLNDNVLKSLNSMDQCIGHLIILSQYEWPSYHNVFQKYITLIRKKYSTKTDLSLTPFVYPHFTAYVRIPDVIEDFMLLVNDNVLEMELSPNSASDQHNPHSTRGITRSYREEIRTLLTHQMASSTHNIPIEMFIDFLLNHIVPYLKVNFA